MCQCTGSVIDCSTSRLLIHGCKVFSDAGKFLAGNANTVVQFTGCKANPLLVRSTFVGQERGPYNRDTMYSNNRLHFQFALVTTVKLFRSSVTHGDVERENLPLLPGQPSPLAAAAAVVLVIALVVVGGGGGLVVALANALRGERAWLGLITLLLRRLRFRLESRLLQR